MICQAMLCLKLASSLTLLIFVLWWDKSVWKYRRAPQFNTVCVWSSVPVTMLPSARSAAVCKHEYKQMQQLLIATGKFIITKRHIGTKRVEAKLTTWGKTQFKQFKQSNCFVIKLLPYKLIGLRFTPLAHVLDTHDSRQTVSWTMVKQNKVLS